MRTPPLVASALLRRLATADDEPLAGDLAEELCAGRPRAWYWRQAISAIVLSAARHAASSPLRTVRAVATGWLTVLLLFLALGDVTTEAVSRWLFGWERLHAYATEISWPVPIVAVGVSYLGFALSGVKVARLFRRNPGPALIAYTASIPIVPGLSAVLVEVLTRRNGSVTGPHALFYAVSIALPYQWRSGLLLAPAVTLLAGLMAARPRLAGRR